MVSLPARRRNAYYLILVAGLLAIIWASYKSFGSSTPEKPLSELLTAIDEKQVASATFTSNGDRVDWVDTQGHQYRTLIPGGYVSSLVNGLHGDQVPFDVTPSSQTSLLLTVILPNLILFLAIGGFMWYMLRQTRQNSKV